MGYWFSLDSDLMTEDSVNITLTFSNASGGSPIDISAWTFYYKAEERGGTDTITVADGSMTKSDSGTGTTDTVTIPLDNSISGVTAGRYDQEIAVVISSEPTVIARGTLTIPQRLTTVS
jgi:hypothetical protein